MQEDGDHRLLGFAALAESRQLVLDLPGLVQLRFEQRAPVRPASRGALGRGDARELAHRLRDAPLAGLGQQGRRADEGGRVPPLGLPQRGRQRAQNAPGTLKPFELCPAAVEDVGQVGVERKAREKPLLGGRSVLGRGFFQLGQIAHDPDDVRAESIEASNVVRLEEAAAQHHRHVLLLHRLDALLALPPEHVGQLGRQPAPQLAPLLVGVGGEYRGHHRRRVDLAHRLGQVLEEIDDAPAPDGIEARLLAGVHQDLVDQDQRRQPAPPRDLQQPGKERFGRRCLALVVESVAMNRAQPVGSRELERQHAPGMAQRAGLAVRSADALEAPLGVDLVEAEGGRERRRQLRAHVLAELLYCRQIRQARGVAEQVAERDQRMRLPAAVGQLELPHRLVAPPREPRRDVLHQLAQRVGRVGQCEELGRVLVDGPSPLGQRNLVQIGCELGQRELSGPQLFLQANDLVPGTGAVGLGHGKRCVRR